MLNAEQRTALQNVGSDGREAVRHLVGLSGFEDFAADIAAVPPTGNPLLDSPWWTLGLWAGTVIVLYKVATWAGQYVARSR